MLQKYVKQFCVLFIEHTLLFSVDDKAIVPVGEPGNPISTGVRGHHRTLVFAASSAPLLAALDHDFHLFGIVHLLFKSLSLPTIPFSLGSLMCPTKIKLLHPYLLIGIVLNWLNC